MICTDANILIYVSKGELPPNTYGTAPVIAPSVVKIEALGYRYLTAIHEKIIRKLLEQDMMPIPLTDSIVERAIDIRQSKKIKLGDAIIAATALEHDCELWTANTDDFADIDGLKLHNPLAGK